MGDPIQVADGLSNGEGGVLQPSGSVAERLVAGGFRAAALRTAGVLRKEEWLRFDQVVIDVARDRLVLFDDLINMGLTFPIENALGTTKIEWEQLSDMEDAEITMDAVTPVQRDRPIYTPKSIPLPIFHKDFRINIRVLEASRSMGQPLDTTMVSIATRKVAELMETTLFDGATLVGDTSSIQGLTNATNRNTGSIPIDWELVGATGELIVTDVLNMIAALETDNMYGPYGLYVPQTYFNKLRNDYKANGDRTILERILAIPGIQFVRSTTRLSGGGTGEVILLQLTSDVIDVVVGQQPTPIEWTTEGGMIHNFKVMAIMVPRVKDDALTQSGIAHFSV